MLFFLIVSLLLAATLIFCSTGVIKVYAFAWSLTLVALGGFFGFIFGLPNKPADINPNSSSNNNIIEISNWLTKIIIGAGLVQLKEIPDFVSKTTRKVAFGIAEKESSEKVFIFTVALGFVAWLRSTE